MITNFNQYFQKKKEINLEELYKESPDAYDRYAEWYLQKYKPEQFMKGEDLTLNVKFYGAPDEEDSSGYMIWYGPEGDSFAIYLPADVDEDIDKFTVASNILKLYVVAYKIAEKLPYPALIEAVNKIDYQKFVKHTDYVMAQINLKYKQC